MTNWKPFSVYQGVQIECRGTPATGQEYRIAGSPRSFNCLTCLKREIWEEVSARQKRSSMWREDDV
jgi:Zn finger protein HypA/HybF involved in hydrogenase expression